MRDTNLLPAPKSEPVFYQIFGKRIFDFLASLLLLVVLLPVVVLVAILLCVFQRGQVLFRQPRPGKSERVFTLYKFKTMTDQRDSSGQLLPDEERITPIGEFVRRWSLDELPQLWNVLKGDMSLVGPRPLLVEYLPLYSPEQQLRHTVRPGITGWAQVNGRNATTWQQRLQHDAWYARNLSLALDLKILIRTLALAISGKGINMEGRKPMERFTGTHN